MTEMVFKKGEVIFLKGDMENWMFDIRFGKVGIYDKYGTEEERLLTTLGPDDFFGEMGMIENLPRSATAVAEEETTANKISMGEFSAYFKDKPSKIYVILQYTSNRMRELSEDYLEAVRALKEYVDLSEKGLNKPQELMKKMKEIAEQC